MKKQTHAIDGTAAVMIAGLRMVTKSDSHYGDRVTYYLELEYRGLSKRVSYKEKSERDAMYHKIIGMLEGIDGDSEAKA